MKLKLDANGNAVLEDGKPVYVYDDGREAAFDAAHTVATITRLNGEAKTRREQFEAADTRLKLFEGIEDPDAARKALDTVKNLSAGELKTAAQVEAIKKEALAAAEETYKQSNAATARRLKEIETERDKFRGDLYDEKVGGSFARSKYVTDKLSVPGDMVQALFGGRFKMEEGKVVGHDVAGNKIFSQSRPGELADFDEALSQIVDSYAHRDSILKGTGSNGGGSKGSGNGGGGGKQMTRAQFQALDAGSRATAMREGTRVVD